MVRRRFLPGLEPPAGGSRRTGTPLRPQRARPRHACRMGRAVRQRRRRGARTCRERRPVRATREHAAVLAQVAPRGAAAATGARCRSHGADGAPRGRLRLPDVTAPQGRCPALPGRARRPADIAARHRARAARRLLAARRAQRLRGRVPCGGDRAHGGQAGGRAGGRSADARPAVHGTHDRRAFPSERPAFLRPRPRRTRRGRCCARRLRRSRP